MLLSKEFSLFEMFVFKVYRLVFPAPLKGEVEITNLTLKTLNMKKLLILLFAVLGIVNKTYSQKLMPIASDCKKAIKIPLITFRSYGPTVSPKGFGDIQEITKSTYSFEKEHNSAWYYFDITQDGDLSLEITPTQVSDDYDFMLFKYTDTSFCRMLANNKIKPVRANIARTGKDGSSKTGLSSESKSLFVQLGHGDSFSKSIEVKKGERYYLVLDNVYPDGLGHIITLGYKKNVQLSGVILNEDNKPIKAEVTLSDNMGNEVKTVVSDSVTGKYDLNTLIWGNLNYNVTIYNDDSFIKTIPVNADSLIKEHDKLVDIKTVLPKLKGCKKCSFKDIHFYPESYEVISESIVMVNIIAKLMKKNPNMIIEIGGHIPGSGKPRCIINDASMSEAEVVYGMLIKKGIDGSRMRMVAYGSLFRIYPDFKIPSNEFYYNVRVEIKVISIE